jgi:hypothetical protein
VGKGKLLVSTLRIRENFDESYPEAMFLFDRLIRYATGSEFNPGVAVSGKQIQKLVVK